MNHILYDTMPPVEMQPVELRQWNCCQWSCARGIVRHRKKMEVAVRVRTYLCVADNNRVAESKHYS